MNIDDPVCIFFNLGYAPFQSPALNLISSKDVQFLIPEQSSTPLPPPMNKFMDQDVG